MKRPRKQKPRKRAAPPQINGAQTQHSWAKALKYAKIIVLFFVGLISFASAVYAFAPRLQIDVPESAEPLRPFPSSVTITNGMLPLDRVSVFVRICRATTPDRSGKIVGSCSEASTGGGGITMPDWQNHRLGMDEKWTIPMGGNVPFIFEVGPADVLIVATYWPEHFPKPWFISLREYPARFHTHRQPDGRVIWIRRPLH
jgi:hypothetical protein